MNHSNQNLTIEKVKHLVEKHIEYDDFGFKDIIEHSQLSEEELKFLKYWIRFQEEGLYLSDEDLQKKAFNQWKSIMREEKLNSILKNDT